MTLTWPKTQDVSSIGVRIRQDSEKPQVEHMFHGGRLKVLEHLWPSLPTCMVIEQQLHGAIVVKLPGPQEAQEECIV